jgi:hypothetical protein
MRDWQPIDTAPKDGTEIIGLFLSGGCYCVRIFWYFTDTDFDNINPLGTREENVGWWSIRTSVASEKTEPTHWIPFPNPITK